MSVMITGGDEVPRSTEHPFVVVGYPPACIAELRYSKVVSVFTTVGA